MASESVRTTCKLCSTAVPVLHCNTCTIDLCKGCVGDHLISQQNVQHKVVAYELKNDDIKHPFCNNHVTFNCDLHCDNCSVPVCSQCCTDTHQDHQVTDITKLYKIKQKLLKRDIDISEHVLLPEYQNLIADLENQISRLRFEYRKLEIQIENQGQKWHQEIDNIVKKYKSEINQLETVDVAVLEKSLSDVHDIVKKINNMKLSNIEILQSIDGSKYINYKSNMNEMHKIQPSVAITSPVFTAFASDPFDDLYRQFGDLIYSIKSFTEGYIVKIPTGLPEEVSVVDTLCKSLWKVKCVNTDEIWINQGSSREIKLLDIDGSLQETVTVEYDCPYDLTTTIDGHLVYSLGWRGGGGVYRVMKGKTEPIITLKLWKPRGICSTKNGDLLVCMTKLVRPESIAVRYSGSTVKQEIKYDDKGYHLYGTDNLFVTESTNKDIWVSDCKANALVVTDQSGKFRFRYTGNLESRQFKTFRPWCIDSDSQGNVLVTDIANSCVHVIDDKGNLTCYIQNVNTPLGISVDIFDRVWIGEHWDGKVKIVKHLKF